VIDRGAGPDRKTRRNARGRRCVHELANLARHVNLSHYLTGWHSWKASEYNLQAKGIHARAKAENLPLMPREAQQANYCTDQASRWSFSAMRTAI